MCRDTIPLNLITQGFMSADVPDVVTIICDNSRAEFSR